MAVWPVKAPLKGTTILTLSSFLLKAVDQVTTQSYAFRREVKQKTRAGTHNSKPYPLHFRGLALFYWVE
jgi:hypothetical protein